MKGLFRPLAFMACLCLAQAQASAQTFDNQSVVALHAAGLGGDVILAKVRSQPCNYDVSTNGLVALKQAGIPQDVIVAMINKCQGAAQAQGIDNMSADPLVAHAPGIYLQRSEANPAQLDLLRPSLGAGLKYTGNGSVLFPFRVTLTVPQARAQLAAGTARPVFYFYFNPADRKVNSFGTAATIAAQSPTEFSFVRFRVDKNTRQFVIGRAQPYVQVLGIDPKNTLPFAAKEVGDGIFRVDFPDNLEPGEYGFMLPGEKGSFRIYDFSVGRAGG